MNILLQGALHLLLSMINNLQLIVHIPMINIVIPANVISMMSVIIPLVMFDILENLKVMDKIFPYSLEDADIHMREYS